MLTKRNTHTVARLKGKEFEAPRKPAILRRKVIKAIDDRIKAGQAGVGTARGHEHEDAEGVLYADRIIDAEVDRAIEDTQRAFKKPCEAATKVREDAQQQQQDAIREMSERDEAIAEVDERIESLGDRHGPGRIGYGLMLLSVFLLNLPLDVGAAQILALSPLMQTLLAVLLGAATTWAAHYCGRAIEQLRESHAKRTQDPFGYRQDQVLLGVAIAVPLLVIVGTTLWRASAFRAAAVATGGIADSGPVNLAFAFIALLAFVVAVIGSLAFRRMKPLRDARKERKRLVEERSYWQLVHDGAERTEAQAEVTLEYLDEQETRMLEALRHLGKERKARVGQHKVHKTMKVVRKNGGASVVIRTNPSQAPDGASAASRRFDIDRIAAEVEARVHDQNHQEV